MTLPENKIAAFKEIHRILKKGGRMVISDLITDKEIPMPEVDAGKWCSCVDGALTKENYLGSIKKAGFSDAEVLRESLYMEGGEIGNRKVTSLVIRAIKK